MLLFSTGDVLNDVILQDRQKNRKIKHCEKCRGCLHPLKNVDISVHIFNTTFVHRSGGSSAWNFESKFACDTMSEEKPHRKGHPQGSSDGKTLIQSQYPVMGFLTGLRHIIVVCDPVFFIFKLYLNLT